MYKKINLHGWKIFKIMVFFILLFLGSKLTTINAYGEGETAIPQGSDYVYGVRVIGKAAHIASYQINGNDQIKMANVQIKEANGSGAAINDANSLAVRADGFYLKENTGTKMYHVDWNGTIRASWNATALTGTARSGAFTPDGKYVTTSDQDSSKKNELYIYDIDNRVLEKKISLTNKTDTDLPASKLFSMGDIASDKDGYLYAVISSSATVKTTTVLKINGANGDIIDILPVPGLKHSPSIAFMEDGRLLIADEDNKGAIVDFSTGLITFNDKLGIKLPNLGTTNANLKVRDFASLNFPEFHVELIAKKSGPETANYGNEFEYTIEVSNIGNMMSLHNVLLDTLSPYLTYVPNSTTLNGTKVADKNGTSPILSGGMKIESPGGVDEAITKDRPAVITFRVKVKDTGDTSVGIDIPNTAYIANVSTDFVSTNKVITKVPGIPISEFILNLHIKQEVLNSRLDLVSPTKGFAAIKNDLEQYTMEIPSYLSDTNQRYKLVKIKASDMNNPYSVSVKTPEFYSYVGYQLTQTESTHLAANRINAPIEKIDLSKGLDRWLTAYIEPKLITDVPPFYNWDYKVNDFGKVSVK